MCNNRTTNRSCPFYFRELAETRGKSEMRAALGSDAMIGGDEKILPNMGLNLQPGELVRVKSPQEIQSTVDEVGDDRCPRFVADMVRYCGGTYRVARRVERVRECSGKMHRVSETFALENVTCSGIPAGGCSLRCHHLWRAAWLERCEMPESARPSPTPLDAEASNLCEKRLGLEGGTGNTPVSLSSAGGALVKSAELQGRFIAPDDPLWQECLDQMPHDFYHEPGYARLCADFEHGESIGFVAEQRGNRLFLPLVIRPIRIDGVADGEWNDASSPYGYPSPLLCTVQEGAARTAFLQSALGLLLQGLRARRVVSIFLRLHPLFPLSQEPFNRYGVLVNHGETVFVDLTRSEEELWQQTRKNYRSRINRAKESGAMVEMDPECSALDDFIAIYWETMCSVGADESYFFSRKYFYELKHILGDALHLATVYIDGSLACAGLFPEVDGIVEAHLVGARRDSMKAEPVKLMMDFVRRWAKARGNRVFHLGGGRGAMNDSLFQFKSGFSKLRSRFCSWRAVIDASQYDALVRRWGQRWGAAADGRDRFFPAYRKPFVLKDKSADVVKSIAASEANCFRSSRRSFSFTVPRIPVLRKSSECRIHRPHTSLEPECGS